MDYIMIHWTSEEKKEVEFIIEILLEKKLIACATIIPDCTSYYTWKDKIEKAQEIKVLIKTKKSLFPKVQKIIEQKSSYDVPQILEVPISSGNRSYLKWMDSSLEKK